MHISVAVAAGMFVSISTIPEAQPSPAGPPLPFEDVGACPFEGCMYGKWTARRAVGVRHERRDTSPVAFPVPRGTTVTALTGVVGRFVEKPKPTREWWVQVRDAAGRVGWTKQPEAFEQPGG